MRAITGSKDDDQPRVPDAHLSTASFFEENCVEAPGIETAQRSGPGNSLTQHTVARCLSEGLKSGTLETVKLAKFHPAARDALRTFPEDVRRAFGKAIHDLQLGHSLAMPLSRAMAGLGTGAAELRIRDSAGVYRAFYVVKAADAVLIFHAFAKKTQKTPDREIELGKKRLKEMLR